MTIQLHWNHETSNSLDNHATNSTRCHSPNPLLYSKNRKLGGIVMTVARGDINVMSLLKVRSFISIYIARRKAAHIVSSTRNSHMNLTSSILKLDKSNIRWYTRSSLHLYCAYYSKYNSFVELLVIFCIPIRASHHACVFASWRDNFNWCGFTRKRLDPGEHR